MNETIQKTTRPLKLDRTRLHTIPNYARRIAKSEVTVRRMVADGRLNSEEIDGVTFVYV